MKCLATVWMMAPVQRFSMVTCYSAVSFLKSDWQYGIKKRGETYCVVATDAEGIVLKEVVNHDKATNEIT